MLLQFGIQVNLALLDCGLIENLDHQKTMQPLHCDKC